MPHLVADGQTEVAAGLRGIKRKPTTECQRGDRDKDRPGYAGHVTEFALVGGQVKNKSDFRIKDGNKT